MAGDADITTFASPYDFRCGDTMEIHKDKQIIVLSCTLPKGHRGKHECRRLLDFEEGGKIVTSVSAVSRWE
jgi:hypothetical protein